MARVLLAKARCFGYGQQELAAPLGVMYIASVLREAAHAVRIYDCGEDWNKPDQFRQVLLAFRPDVVGLSGITFEGRVLEGMARMCKATFPNVPVIVGGPHASAYPDRCARRPDMDYIVVGEGERTGLELVNALTCGGRDPRSIPGTAWYDKAADRVAFAPPREWIQDLDSVPFPAWDLIDIGLYARNDPASGMGRRLHMEVLTSRGCPFKCIYCHEVQGKRFRARSPENVLAELNTLRERHGINDFEIIDDIFNFDRARMLDIMDRIIAARTRPKLHFSGALRADLLDAAQIDRLYRAGGRFVSVAVESTSPRIQKLIKKNLKIEKVEENIAIAARRGFYVNGFFMLGFPTETYEEARNTVEWALRTRLHQAHFYMIMPYAGTALYKLYQDTLYARGVTELDIFAQNYHKGSVNLSEMTDEQLFKLQREAYRRMHFDPRRALRILWRHQGRKRLLAKAMLAAYYALPFGRVGAGDTALESAWDFV